MAITLEWGWWIVPAVWTASQLGIARLLTARETGRGGDYGSLGNAAIGLWNALIYLLAALSASVSWLIWAVFK